MNGEDPVVIRPAAYTPSTAETTQVHWLVRHRLRVIGSSAGAVVLVLVWFLFTARSVRFEMTPADASIAVAGGFHVRLGETWILREGNYTLEAHASGYEPLAAPLTVGGDASQTYRYALTPLPGIVDLDSNAPSARVVLDGQALGTTPIAGARIAAGHHTLELKHPRYQPLTQTIEIEGHEKAQRFALELAPNWAVVSLDSSPPGAAIFIDDAESATTPAGVEILAGSHAVRLKHAGFKSWLTRVEVVAGADQQLPRAVLEPADALVNVTSDPPGAGITVDGRYQGETPSEVNLLPGRPHRIRVSKAGFAPTVETVTLATAEERALRVALAPLVGNVVIDVKPKDAQLSIDGIVQPSSSGQIKLAAKPHRVEVRKAGYETYEGEITPQPNLTQELAVHLLTLAEARLRRLTPSATDPNSGTLVLLAGGEVEMGASRREPGRRANEALREVTVSRLFYLGAKEVSNAQFRKFQAGHTSGKFEEQDLDKDDQPAVRMSWEDAVLYCNWLSTKANLPLFYRVESGRVVGFDSKSTGYRLPTEAEWTWAARTAPDRQAMHRFAWGDDLPPPDAFGNFADRSAAHVVGRIIYGFNDNYVVSAPVGTFKPDARGIYDLAGNVAEWINDYYEIPPESPATDPMGPPSGQYHVIKGSSWMSGTVSDLRIAFRDYGEDGRPDLGFRVARFAE